MLHLLAGGGGRDSFVFRFHSNLGLADPDTRQGAGARDVIADFSPGEDIIDLSGYSWLAEPGVADAGEPAFLGRNDLRPELAVMQVRYSIEGDRTVIGIHTPSPYGGPLSVEIELAGAVELRREDFVF